MLEKLIQFQDFDGDLDALADAANVALGLFNVGDAAGVVTPRLVRDYAQRGILTKPDRRGREARYGFRQLVELLAARSLVRDGWPLNKVAELVASSSLDDLTALIRPARPTTAAVSAVKAIRDRRPDFDDVMDIRRLPASMSIGPTHRAARLAELRAELPVILSELGGAPPLEPASTVELPLAPDLRLSIGQERLRRLSLEDAERIGRAVVAALVSAAAKGGKS